MNTMISLFFVFQFTPLREGLRNTNLKLFKTASISIHAPAGGASGLSKMFPITLTISIHAPAGGASSIQQSGHTVCKFQFTPLREGLQDPLTPFAFDSDFNSRPCGRGFIYQNKFPQQKAHFNSRPCGRGFLISPLCSTS